MCSHKHSNNNNIIETAEQFISTWNHGIVPMMDSMLRQQPLSKVGHFEEHLVYSKPHNIKTLLSSGILNNNGTSTETTTNSEPLPDITYKYTKPGIFKNSIGTVAESNNLTTVCYYTKPWQFTSKNTIEENKQFLKEFESLIQMDSVVDYQLSEEKYFPQCDGTIQLTLIIDVNKIK
jgi:hypothetical protein